MVVAGPTLFVAGPPELTKTEGVGQRALKLTDPEEALAAWEGKRGGLLWAVSAADGKQLAQYKLDVPPIFDGMAAAGGKLYLALIDGTLACHAAKKRPSPARGASRRRSREGDGHRKGGATR